MKSLEIKDRLEINIKTNFVEKKNYKLNLSKKGKILIPVFAVGRSQEVMLVLEKACMEGKLDNMPVYLDGMIWEATAIHSAYPEYLNNNLRNKIYQQNRIIL